MKKFVVGITLASLLMLALIWTAVGAPGNFVFSQPVVVTVQQAIPVEVTVSVPTTGKQVITTTVPLTVNVNLQVSIQSPSNVVVKPISQTMAHSKSLEISHTSPTEVDLVGARYEFINVDKALRITDWTTYTTKNGYFEVAGELENVTTDQRFSLVDFVVKFYNARGKLINVENASAGGRWVDPGQSLPFKIQTGLTTDDFSSYTVEAVAGDLGSVP